MKKIAALLLLPMILLADDLQIGKYLNMIANGKTDEVRSVMLDLYVEHPDDPGVMLLAGAVLQDAFKAMDFYQKIIQEHPNSEWSDDAMWRIIQFYAILGDETRANAALEVMRQKYPTSQFLVPATDVVRSAVGLAAYQKENEMKLPKLDMSSAKREAQPAPTQIRVTPESQPVAQTPTTKKLNNMYADNSTEMGKDDSSLIEQDLARLEQERAKIEQDIARAKQEDARKKTAQDLLRQQREATATQDRFQEPTPDFDKLSRNTKPEPDNMDVASAELSKIDPPKPSTPISYGLQVGSFNTRDLAEQEQQKFLAQRMRTEIIPISENGISKFAVVIGAYSSKRSAEAAKIIVSRQCSCEPIVISK